MCWMCNSITHEGRNNPPLFLQPLICHLLVQRPHLRCTLQGSMDQNTSPFLPIPFYVSSNLIYLEGLSPDPTLEWFFLLLLHNEVTIPLFTALGCFSRRFQITTCAASILVVLAINSYVLHFTIPSALGRQSRDTVCQGTMQSCLKTSFGRSPHPDA